MGDPETLENKWLTEQALSLAWQLFVEKKKAELQMAVQQQAAAAQQQAMAAMAQSQGQGPADDDRLFLSPHRLCHKKRNQHCQSQNHGFLNQLVPAACTTRATIPTRGRGRATPSCAHPPRV